MHYRPHSDELVDLHDVESPVVGTFGDELDYCTRRGGSSQMFNKKEIRIGLEDPDQAAYLTDG